MRKSAVGERGLLRSFFLGGGCLEGSMSSRGKKEFAGVPSHGLNLRGRAIAEKKEKVWPMGVLLGKRGGA